jgi:hypothetical protein
VAMSPEQRSLQASAMANARWAKSDPKEALRPLFDARMERLRDQVDPDRSLPETERERRVRAAMRSQMKFLALKSARARAARVAEKRALK